MKLSYPTYPKYNNTTIYSSLIRVTSIKNLLTQSYPILPNSIFGFG